MNSLILMAKVQELEVQLAAARARVAELKLRLPAENHALYGEIRRRERAEEERDQLRAQLALAEKCVDILRVANYHTPAKDEALAAYDKFKEEL